MIDKRILSILQNLVNPVSMFYGIACAQEIAARHGINENVDRAPAANIPLSAACRCASYLPSVPSVLPPKT